MKDVDVWKSMGEKWRIPLAVVYMDAVQWLPKKTESLLER